MTNDLEAMTRTELIDLARKQQWEIGELSKRLLDAKTAEELRSRALRQLADDMRAKGIGVRAGERVA